ncbi:hypothetical protein H6F75_26835 [Nodosilinea sp. FACHB-131]|uniref:hypothetical protein n=1 Tax=Cyanophyceae TaxID=3028117 RepID=UPI00168A308B|nr:hypothetical protein [Nodosilinea sp. FACHB-131]MBD1877105.1 hypothetical protein [Nodosilinea sp. FACHB-131]
MQVHLYPQLSTAGFRQACLDSWKAQEPLALSARLDPGLNGPVVRQPRRRAVDGPGGEQSLLASGLGTAIAEAVPPRPGVE